MYILNCCQNYLCQIKLNIFYEQQAFNLITFSFTFAKNRNTSKYKCTVKKQSEFKVFFGRGCLGLTIFFSWSRTIFSHQRKRYYFILGDEKSAFCFSQILPKVLVENCRIKMLKFCILCFVFHFFSLFIIYVQYANYYYYYY